MTTPQAYIVDAVRTPVGKRNGSLAKAWAAMDKAGVKRIQSSAIAA